jgi:Skp family chaperone for outer membrane proteins
MFKTLFLGALLSANAAYAGGIAIVDFNKAGSLVKEGTKIQSELKALQAEREKQIKGMESQIMSMRADYEKQAMILSEDTRKQKETEIMAAQQQFQQAVVAAQQEMAAAYETKAAGLFERMRSTCELIGKEKGYDLVLEVSQGGVVYSGSSDDITAELVTRFDAGQ